jgi:hypothetical protein
MLASLILLAVALLPLAHPATRSRLLHAVRPLRGEDGKAQDAPGKGG